MKKNIKIKNIFLFIFVCLINNFVLASDISVNATISSQQASVGEELTYQITVSGLSNISPPNIPQVDGLNIYGFGTRSNISFDNGQTTSSYVFSYIVTPIKEGNFEIPSFKFEYANKIYLVNSVSFSVSAAKTEVQPPAQTNQTQNQNTQQKQNAPLLFVKNTINKKSAFVNEPIILTFQLYTRTNLLSSPNYTPSETIGFLRQNFGKDTQNYEMLNGYKYLVLSQKTLLYPTAAGKKEITPAKIQVAIEEPGNNSNDFWARTFFSKPRNVNISTEKLTLDIKTLPTDAPKEFNGTVGKNLKISIKLTPNKDFKQGEPINIEVKIEGEANINALQPPILGDITNFRQYDTLEQMDAQIGENGVFGNKIFKFVLSPNISGDLKLPDIYFVYFDYEKRKYVNLSRNLGEIKVEKNDDITEFSNPDSMQNTLAQHQQVSKLAEDIRFIKLDSKLSYGERYFFRTKKFVYLVIIFPLVYVLIILILILQPYLLKHHHHFFKLTIFNKTIKNFDKILADIHKNPNITTDTIFLISDIFEEYFIKKLHLQKKNITISDIKHLKKLDDKILNEIENLWEDLNFLKFGTHKISKQEIIKIITEIKEKLNEWDKTL